ncbi:MAG: hypothetical protein KAR21_04045, partial [Spirochaetales bacterium]|nr:hypothetical protein [Spirochaetales bacterium]
TGYLSHKRAYFLGEWGGKCFKGKGIIRVGFGMAKLLNRVPIQQKHTFSVEVESEKGTVRICDRISII